MSLSAIQPVPYADVAKWTTIRVDSLGSLVIGRPPPYSGYVEEYDVKLHRELDNAAHVHHLKVVDTAKDETEVLSYAKWELHPHGRTEFDPLRGFKDPAEEQVDEYGALRAVAHHYFSSRNSEMGKSPHILLALLVTAREHRGKGAGRLLLGWGIEKSEEIGLPLYLQASDQGRRLYSHYGFEELGRKQVELTQFGLSGVEVMTEMIRQRSSAQKQISECPSER